MKYDQLKILIVDDERAQVDATVRRLKKKGASAIGVTTIDDAEDQINENEFNIAIVDLNFDRDKRKEKETAGIQILKYLKEKSPETYRIIRSVYNEPDVYSEIFGYHGYAHRYSKKSTLGDLDRIIEEYIKETEASVKQNMISCGDLAYDRDKKVFYLLGQPLEDIKLTSAQIKLLVYLLENQLEYVSKTSIHKHLGCKGSENNVIAVYINAIRKQFKELGYEDFIKTRNSIGYRIVSGTYKK